MLRIIMEELTGIVTGKGLRWREEIKNSEKRIFDNLRIYPTKQQCCDNRMK